MSVLFYPHKSINYSIIILLISHRIRNKYLPPSAKSNSKDKWLSSFIIPAYFLLSKILLKLSLACFTFSTSVFMALSFLCSAVSRLDCSVSFSYILPSKEKRCLPVVLWPSTVFYPFSFQSCDLPHFPKPGRKLE